jgi:hypothetical protein
MKGPCPKRCEDGSETFMKVREVKAFRKEETCSFDQTIFERAVPERAGFTSRERVHPMAKANAAKPIVAITRAPDGKQKNSQGGIGVVGG